MITSPLNFLLKYSFVSACFLSLLLKGVSMGAVEYKLGDYSVQIANGYGWKVTELPEKFQGKGVKSFLQKDGGHKNIMFVETDKTFDELERVGHVLKLSIEKGKRGAVFTTERIIWLNRDAIKVEYYQKNNDDDIILGVARLFFEGERAVSIICNSGIVNPVDDEETNTILSTFILSNKENP